MEEMDQEVISLFDHPVDRWEVHQTMRDFSTLAGVFKELGDAKTFESPIEILVFLRIIQFFKREALGIDDPIENAETVYYRYRDVYGEEHAPSKRRVRKLVNLLIRYNWVAQQARRLKMRNTGKRLMDALIRAANDSLAYYMQDEIGRSLFQARRDAEISKAYDDQGISGGHIVASMVRHLQDAITLLKERELELLADRDALPQLKLIQTLMKELEKEMDERFKRFETIEDGLMMTDLMLEGTEAISEGISLSMGLINRYLKFISMQATDIGSIISPEKTRQFIENMFHPPIESDIPDAYQIFSFMEQNQYTGEAKDGIWLPVKMAPSLSGEAIDRAVDYLENYEPYVDDATYEEEEIQYETEMIEADEIEEVYGDALWQMTKKNIDTEAIEQYLREKENAELEEVMIESSSTSFGDAIRSLMGLSALHANKRVTFKKYKVMKTYKKDWEWMSDVDREYRVRTVQRENSE